jgi:hypothetical protein
VKKSIYILTILFSINYSVLWSQGIDLDEEEAYELVNTLFKKDIEDLSDILLFNELQLFYENYETIEYPPKIDEENSNDSIVVISLTAEELNRIKSKPNFSDKVWKEEKLKNIFLFSDTGISIDDFEERKKYFIDKYGTYLVHNVSFPKFIFKRKIAVIRGEIWNNGVYMDCIERQYCFLYIKDGTEWKSLKKYGDSNIYSTLENYYKSTNN